ncbi:hypothetical protein [Paractinoplanes ferrugineus]|uniref:hypothetical protein n=1 Tax=Paractinoplanes ferrugineus TaxID=113564 RepID=UPI001EF29347|nr:hypothetical protein [Actinoplanes ferrugineus]
MPSIADSTTASPSRMASRSRSSSLARPVNPARSGGNVSCTRTCETASISPPTARNACRHEAT